MPDFSFLPRASFCQNLRGVHALQVFDGVGIENVLGSGGLSRLLAGS